MSRVVASIALLLSLMAPSAGASETPALGGFMFDGLFASPTLDRWMPYRIYLPPDYYSSDTRRYPTLYMLHGAGGNYTEWSDSYLPQQIDDLILRGLVQPMIVVMPDGGGRTYFANWDNGPRYSDYLAYDVTGEIDTHYRTLATPSARAVGGLSMGGLAALQVSMRHPGVFGVVGAHSPSIRLEPDPELWFISGQSFLQHDPIFLSRTSPGADRMVYWLDVGADDWWRSNIETLHSALTGAGLSVTWRIFPGTHEADYWIEHVPDYVRFYGDNLRAG